MAIKVLASFLAHPFLGTHRSLSQRRSMSSIQSVLEKLTTEKSVFLLDGGTGEELFRRGVPDDREIWSATAVVNSEHHDTLRQVHRDFLKAGSQAITTNSYGITPGVGFDQDQMVRYIAMAGDLARQSVPVEGSSFVFGSLGPLVESYRADLILPREEGVPIYEKMVQALEPYVDCFLAETMSCVEESLQAVEAVSSTKPLLVSFTLDSDGNMRDGEAVTTGIERLVSFCEEKGVTLLGVLFNCAEPEAITKALVRLKESELCFQKDLLLGAYANRLTPIDPDWTLEDSEGPQPMRDDLSPE